MNGVPGEFSSYLANMYKKEFKYDPEEDPGYYQEFLISKLYSFMKNDWCKDALIKNAQERWDLMKQAGLDPGEYPCG